jgi:hypothetical protein
MEPGVIIGIALIALALYLAYMYIKPSDKWQEYKKEQAYVDPEQFSKWERIYAETRDKPYTLDEAKVLAQQRKSNAIIYLPDCPVKNPPPENKTCAFFVGNSDDIKDTKEEGLFLILPQDNTTVKVLTMPQRKYLADVIPYDA